LKRRAWIRTIGVSLACRFLPRGISETQAATDPTQTDHEWLERARERMRRATEEDAKEVERLYSTRPIRFILGPHTYEIPANYFGPKDFRDWPQTPNVEAFGFFLFLPDYIGYTKENWRDRFDRRRIDVLELTTVQKIEMGNFTDGTRRWLSPDRFDPRVQFENIRSLQEEASLRLYGLTMYRNKGGGNTPGAVWTGTRSNGEFFWFRTSLAANEAKRDGWPPNPSCTVRYYSEKEDLRIAYHYSQDHLAKWREIDDAIWVKIHQWRRN
jgi:hypothetical protein